MMRTLAVRVVVLTAVVWLALWMTQSETILQTDARLEWRDGDAVVIVAEAFPAGGYWCVPWPEPMVLVAVEAPRREAYLFADGPSVEFCASRPGRWRATARRGAATTSFDITVERPRGMYESKTGPVL